MAINNGNAYQNQFGQFNNQQQMYGMNQQFMGQNYGNQGMMNSASRPGLSVVPIDTDEQITNYPVASGNTVLFINFNTNRMCFKSTNTNSVPMPLQWASFTYDQVQSNNQYPQNQNAVQSVSRQEFDELKVMMQRTLDAVQNQNFRARGKHDKQRGYKDDRPDGISADDE